MANPLVSKKGSPYFLGIGQKSFHMLTTVIPRDLEHMIFEEKKIEGAFEILDVHLVNVNIEDLGFIFYRVENRQAELGIKFEFSFERDILKNRVIVRWRPVRRDENAEKANS